MKTAGGQRLEVVDSLRGIAVLLVCISHFMIANNGIPKQSWGSKVYIGGWVGVDVFFVISGFIIPYALHRACFTLADYPRFVVRRMIRLDPPYLVAIILTIVAGTLASKSAFFQGVPFQFTVPQVLAHFAFLNAFLNFDWLNPAFWTLAIEFQYYLLIGLLHPLISHRSMAMRSILVPALGCLALAFPDQRYVFHWMFLFMVGMIAFQWRAGLLSPLALVGSSFFSTAGIAFTHGLAVACVCLATSVMIMFGRLRSRVLLFFGTISYSLYLLHGPIGLRVVNLLGRNVSTTSGGLLVIVCGMTASTICAFILYKFVERPAQRLASTVRYKRSLSRTSND